MAKLVKQKHGGAVNQFEKGESGNPNGRPPKLLRHINDDLKQRGYEPVTASQLVEAIALLVGLPQDEITKLKGDKDLPKSFNIIIKELEGKYGFAALRELLDRAYGKAKQSTDITTGGEKIIAPVIEVMNADQAKRIEDIEKRLKERED